MDVCRCVGVCVGEVCGYVFVRCVWVCACESVGVCVWVGVRCVGDGGVVSMRCGGVKHVYLCIRACMC